MNLSKSLLTLSILSCNSSLWAVEEQQTRVQLETIILTADADQKKAVAKLQQDQLAQAPSTLGDALHGVPGVVSGQFGAGASRPVIRGQEGARLKVTTNASDTMDVSTLSPDHVITVDPQLAQSIELIRGPEALLYGAGTPAGVVNVVDNKILTQMPEKGYEAQAGFRYNTGNDEKLTHAGATVALGEQFALRLEGLTRRANNYIAPDYLAAEPHGDHVHYHPERRVADTFADSDQFNVGLSWIGDRGFTGLAYSKRKDQYGLPGHSHEYESCHTHGLSLSCAEHDHDETGDDHDHEHDHGDHDHDHGGPWIDMVSERYDFRSELNDPFAGFKRLKFQASYTDYRHDELEEQSITTRFKSKAYDSRVELFHLPIVGWEGSIGLQGSQQKLDLTGEEAIMAPSTTQKYSLFAFEQKQLNDAVKVELAGRVDHQKIDIDSKQKDYSGTAGSASAAAHWQFKPDYQLSFSASHQQRLPLAQELYSDGKHFATNTYEVGNEDLKKEASNNLELGLSYDNDRLDYKLNVYHQWFDDFIYAKTLDHYHDFRLIKYSQDKAKFYGAEAEVNYQFSPRYKAGVFGDYVRGKIESDNAPRIPAGRLGTKVNAQFDERWSGNAEFYHVFQQDKIAAYESETPSYNMLNLGVAYTGQYKIAQEYRVFLNANNLLDEKVYQHASFLPSIPQMGRNFVMGVDFKF
ncbi:zinc piracy TonB-dependent receptor ZnuD [Acinetobacter rudis]|uniref:zinc piracy TonB-dependent receptor ZnuD n=1 Tax=Acinetobacter rudis TaxID=632955 RepID=UPI00280FD6E1|nr:zinc piracy TonB-dependent receptor ZnuD [Acinetobacter rudis]MDQ8954167.1 zinc piracy TonB-dependent receptor ZnuD [Acinetobacter rudis]